MRKPIILVSIALVLILILGMIISKKPTVIEIEEEVTEEVKTLEDIGTAIESIGVFKYTLSPITDADARIEFKSGLLLLEGHTFITELNEQNNSLLEETLINYFEENGFKIENEGRESSSNHFVYATYYKDNLICQTLATINPPEASTPGYLKVTCAIPD